MTDPAPSCGVGIPAPFLEGLKALKDKRVLVTGGAGFLGGHIVQVLLQAGAKIRVFDVVAPRENHGIWKSSDPVEVVVGNLLNKEEVSTALSGCWCVIHVASPNPTSRNAALFQSVNIDGTRLLLECTKAAGIQRFVFTSSASVVFNGRDQRNLNETAPPPMAAMDAYTKSKLGAENLVLQANTNDFWTAAIRPHGIFGARDPHFLPVLAQTGAKGKSKFLIGDGSNLVDFTYVENVAYSHALAAVQLGPGAKINGQAYFITNREPIFFWEIITRLHRAWGYVLPHIALPVPIMRPVAKTLETIASYAKFLPIPPNFTTQAINYSGCAHYYSSDKAGQDMGYQPPVDMDEAIKRSLNYYWELRNKAPKAVLDRLAKAKKGSSVKDVPPRLYGATQSPVVKACAIITVALLFLFTLGCSKTFYVGLAAVLLYLVSVYRDSFGAKAVMYQNLHVPALLKQSQSEKTIVITGANRGIGFNTAKEFLELGFAQSGNGRLIITSREAARGEKSVAELKAQFPQARVEVMSLDLASFASVKAFAANLKKSNVVVDIFIHNAGAMLDAKVTTDGFDEQFQSNFLSHYYLTQLLIKESILAPSAKIINVSSMMHRLVGNFYPLRYDDMQDLASGRKGYSNLSMYCRTKFMQIMWAGAQQRIFNREVNAARLKNPTSPTLARKTIVSVNPGAVATDFILHFIPSSLAKAIEPLLLFLVEKTPKQGVQAIIYAALSLEMQNVGGVYVDNCNVCLPSHYTNNEEAQDYVVAKCEEWIAKAK